MKKKLNLTQVAKHLGVSIATVSNAFNRPDQLSNKLRERILEESAKLGYHGPNMAARSLRMGASGVIGVMLADSLTYSFSDPVASQLLQGISEVLVENKKQLLILSGNVDSAEQSTAESLPDGFILYGTPRKKSIEQIERLGKPIVKVDSRSTTSHTVNINNREGAREIALHAITNGNLLPTDPSPLSVLGLRLIDNERICRLNSNDVDNESQEISQSRLAGYLDAAQQSKINLPFDKIWHIPINKAENAEVAAREALTTYPQPKLLLCMSDIIALSALKVARELGIKVPEEVMITGFDDIPEAGRSEPGITTICQQSIEKGRVAANLLIQSISEEVPLKHLTLDTRLVVRRSCPAST
ncbi:LacI family DNA-binding transcriptional regulator [Glaciecola sp. MH2013]|uniref:LacI family DNA-binding transcriptional regulator n=1 Tax=Glaciecola sp. MH2013 TaxID=2785524 RepID=UPI0018A117D3|nr:LacI family DNA-binding transcriptional regulator [Glaciecola sp. MH2013]MBF7073384.1 LacI family DNA-binding transcriptional regulator [Glaciecola sp. MH2013]